jgi:hypothetical protein
MTQQDICPQILGNRRNRFGALYGSPPDKTQGSQIDFEVIVPGAAISR